jgi:hypothetical protein
VPLGGRIPGCQADRQSAGALGLPVLSLPRNVLNNSQIPMINFLDQQVRGLYLDRKVGYSVAS